MITDGLTPRIELPSPERFFSEFAALHKPVVITGATKNWIARSKWTREYLRASIGPKMVRVKDSNSRVHPDLFSGDGHQRLLTMQFTEYVDLVWSDDPARNKRYLSGDEIRFLTSYTIEDPALAALRADFETPAYFDKAELNACGFWLSAFGVIASLHYDSDGSHNLNVQVRGKKRVLLFHPREFLYPFSGTRPSRGPSNFSQVNIDNPDLARFPRFRHARCQEAILEEGDMLFIPSYWGHAVYHLGHVNINVNFWWQPNEYHLSKTSLRASFLELLTKTLAKGRPLPTGPAIDATMRSLDPETIRFLQAMEDSISGLYKI